MLPLSTINVIFYIIGLVEVQMVMSNVMSHLFHVVGLIIGIGLVAYNH